MFTSAVTGVQDEMEEEQLVLCYSSNHLCCVLLCYAMLSVVIVCAGENEGRSQEGAADIGGKQCFVVLFFIESGMYLESVALCPVIRTYYAMLSVVRR